MSDGREAFLRFRELERQVREALDADEHGAQGWGWVSGNLERVYRGHALPGTEALRNLGRPLGDFHPADERSVRRVDQLAREFGTGLGLPPGSWAAGPAEGWQEALGEVAQPWLAAPRRLDERPRPASPRPAGWDLITGLGNAEHFLREALAGDPRGETATLVLDVVLAPLYAGRVPPTTLPTDRLRALDLGPAAATEVGRFVEQAAAGFTRPGFASWQDGSVPGWDEAVAERAPWWLAAAAGRRRIAERVGLELPEPAPPTLHDAPGWRQLVELRELEQRLRTVLTETDDLRRLDEWLRPLYDGSLRPGDEPGPLALSSAAQPTAALAAYVRDLAGGAPGWGDGLVAVAPAWLAAAELRARPPEPGGLMGRLRSSLRRGRSA